MSAGVTYISDINDADIDTDCQMKHWLTTYYEGTGIHAKDRVIPDAILGESRRDFRTIAHMEDVNRTNIQRMVDDIIVDVKDVDKKNIRLMELLYRRLGWLVAYGMFIEWDNRKLHKNVPIDEDTTLEKGNLWVISHPGRVLKARYTNELTYQEFVPTTVITKPWIDSWSYRARLHVGAAAASAALRKAIDYVQIVGVAKGYTSRYDQKLIHPYVYGKYNIKTGMWSCTVPEQHTGESWVEKPVWEYPGGVVQWVTNMGAQTAQAQFPTSGKLAPNSTIVEEWVAHRLNRERTINGVKYVCTTNEHMRQVHFPKNPISCKMPYSNEECPFIRACWDSKPLEILKSGRFIVNPRPGGP